jgi:RNA polymerase sigma factor (sigma-70 family)
MPDSPLTKVVHYLRRVTLLRDGGGLSDAQLLELYLSRREDAAFAALVRRHGPMVWGVCRRVIGNHHDAEDAFQATFLVLVRKAASIIPRQMVGNWLHGVAYQTALKARAAIGRRSWKERQLIEMPEPEAEQESWSDLMPLLDRELSRLPERYREAVILCDLEGMTHKEAARQLGCPQGTISARVARARTILAKRLARHGVALSVTSLAAALMKNTASASVPLAVMSGTIKAVTSVAAGQTATAAVSTQAAVLAKGVLKTMFLTKLTVTLAIAMTVGGLACGVGYVGHAVATDQASIDSTVQAASSRVSDIFQRRTVYVAQKSDAERIIGTWRVAKLRINGQDEPAESLTLARMVFSGDAKFDLAVTLGQGMGGTYKINAPGQLELTLVKENNQQKNPGIYKFEGDDRLSCCIGVDNNSKRPTEFTADKDSAQVLLILSRATPGEESPTAQDKAKFKNIGAISQAAARDLLANKFRQIGVAVHAYAGGNKETLPAHAIYSKDGKTPLLSWRVAILPYLDQDALYKEFKLDEPWDSEHNKKLIAKIPDVYRPAGLQKLEVGMTHVQVFTGPDTAFVGNKKIRFPDITDGPSNTILAIEANEPVIWTKPADLTLPKEKDKLPAVGGELAKATFIVFFDGLVQLVHDPIDPVLLRALVTPNGGEAVERSKLK